MRATRVLALLALLVALAPACSGSSKHQAAPAAQPSKSAKLVLPEVRDNPPAPKPEPITVTELPLPPVAPDVAGTCTATVNPQRTGCTDQAVGLQSGGFLPGGHEVSAILNLVGAPDAPDPASVYSGLQLIVVKTDGSTFPNGSAWKCLSCGIPTANEVGRGTAMDYPQPFADGKRILSGTNVFDCSPYALDSSSCTPQRMHVYPIRFNTTADGAGKGGFIRELRLNPDNVHLGFNAIKFDKDGVGQFAYFARLTFNPAPKTGLPLAPRYDLTTVTRLYNPAPTKQPLYVDPRHPGQLVLNPAAQSVGELRGFSKDGREVAYIGSPDESDNVDVFAANLATGKVRRLTSNPEYTDPIDLSPDGNWTIAMDTRGSGRQLFMSAMRGVPPLTDQVTVAAVSSVRNNGVRRFFEPYLIDRNGDRGAYQGQQINACANPADSARPGSVCDPNWNGEADPRWSPDGTQGVYWQALAVPPACDGANPLPCEKSIEPGGRTARMMLAHFTSRKPLPVMRVSPLPDVVSWGTPYIAGSPIPSRAIVPSGSYTLRGSSSGSASVTIADSADGTVVQSVSARYTNYSDDGAYVLNGTESVSGAFPSPLVSKLDWNSDLTQTGYAHGTKQTSAGGFHLTINIESNIFQATGSLTTTIDGRTYRQPANAT
jgi:hypothetical protein